MATLRRPLSGDSLDDQRRRFVLLMLAPATLLLVVLTLGPFLISVILSLTDYSLASKVGTKFVGLGNYLHLLGSADFWEATRTTVVFTVSAVALETLVGIVVASALFHERFGGPFLRAIYMIPMAIAPVAVTYIFRLMFNPSLGVINNLLEAVGIPGQAWLADPALALPTLVLIDAWQWTPFVLLIVYGGLVSLPAEPFEAARVDGAGGWSIFRHLTLPMLRPFLAVAVLIRGLDALKTFDIIFVLTGGGPGTSTRTLNLLVFKQGMQFLNMGSAAAIAIVMLAISTVVARVFVGRTGILTGDER
jgi:multiple sugar transport system permease protein